MAEPILNAPRVVASIGQGVAAGVAQHVNVHGDSEGGALADALAASSCTRRDRDEASPTAS
jgi:hypothetical protein